MAIKPTHAKHIPIITPAVLKINNRKQYSYSLTLQFCMVADLRHVVFSLFHFTIELLRN